ncbi:hypothetical protein [Patulibacter americanus]|uniref:hypothetical protein n=1 Tax=Patulibacter americanus TaxID=588672 RepID=UPI0003B58600|nr:hypothetical protein [Patulibacter americanus]
MRGPRHTTRRRVAILVAALGLLALLVVLDRGVALELAPALGLLALVALGWMPGEERLVRAMRRRVRRLTGRPPVVRLRGPRVARVVGRAGSGPRADRGPPVWTVPSTA